MLAGGLVASVASGLAGAWAAGDRLPTALPASGYEVRKRDDTLKLPRTKAAEIREDALARAALWLEPRPSLDLRHNPRDFLGGATEVACKFYPHKVQGTTSKFLCVFEGGEVLKVKYGHNREIYTETAASRLLHALGAGADSVAFVERLRCFGCPEDPKVMLACISSVFKDWVRECEPLFGQRTPAGALQVSIDYGRYVDFGPVSVERRLDAKAIETPRASGWGFDELDRAQGGPDGHARAERDALRLLTVLLDNWDTRADNQRLVCLDKVPARDKGECRRPFAYMQDVGATFGSGRGLGRKLDLAAWKALPVWKDEAACRVKLDAPPLAGATFGEAVISERGRQYLARRLARLTPKEVRDVFEGAHFADGAGAKAGQEGVDEWVRTFQDKVRQITAREPCPTP
jgi:hypothetical protein